MADLNSLIAQGYQPQAPIDPFAQYAKMQQLNTGMNQNALAQYQLESAKRTDMQANALNSAFANATDPTSGEIDYGKVRSALASGGAGSQIPGVEKQRLEQLTAQLTQQKLAGEVAKQPLELAKARIEAVKAQMDQSAMLIDRIDPNSPNAGAQLMAWHEHNHAPSLLGDTLRANGSTPEKTISDIQAAVAKGPQGISDFITRAKLGQQEFAKLIAPKPEKVTDNKTTFFIDLNPKSPTFGQKIGNAGFAMQTTPGEDLNAATQIRGQNVSAETTRRGQNMVDAREQARITMAQEDQRRAADPAFQQQMAGAKQLGQAMATNQVLRETQLPKVLDTAAQTISQIDALIGKRDENGNLLKNQKPHPGFANAVGAGLPLRFIPGTSESDFQTRFDQIKGGAFLQAFETLKGGGSITNVEGEKGTSALNRMNLAQSEKEFVQAAREFQTVIRTGVERAKKMANKPTAVPTGSAPAAATGVDTSNPLLN
jgi:hypothetical protein